MTYVVVLLRYQEGRKVLLIGFGIVEYEGSASHTRRGTSARLLDEKLPWAK